MDHLFKIGVSPETKIAGTFIVPFLKSLNFSRRFPVFSVRNFLGGDIIFQWPQGVQIMGENRF
jgi:hypothetical protein